MEIYVWYSLAGVFFLATLVCGFYCVRSSSVSGPGTKKWLLLMAGTSVFLVAAIICATRANILHGVFSKEGKAPYQYQIKEGPNRLILESDSPIRILRRGGQQ